jgi:hypothetical protein
MHKADKELIADIRNKLQASMTALELISQGKKVPKELIEMAKRGLSGIAKALEMKNIWEWKQGATKEETELYNVMLGFEEEYFTDLTMAIFAKSDITRSVFKDGKTLYNNFDDFGLSIEDCAVRVMKPKVNETKVAYYSNTDNMITFLKGRYERRKRLVLLHEMIHAYDHRLTKWMFLRDYLLIHLYNKVGKKIGKKRLRSILVNETHTDFHIDTGHSIFFVLKTLELDIRLNKKYGTVLAYGRDKWYGNK